MTQIEYVNELRELRAAAERQLSYFKSGLKIHFEGVDRTGSHFSLLKKMIKNYDKLLETLDLNAIKSGQLTH